MCSMSALLDSLRVRIQTARRGELVTREPIPEQDGAQGTGSED